MKLYKLDNEIGSYYVIAKNPTEAEEKLINILNKYDYGFARDREVKTITVIATAVEELLTNKFLIL